MRTKGGPVIIVMGQDCQDFLKICLESVKTAKNIIFCDGGSTDLTLKVALDYKAQLIHKPYNKADKLANSKQRQYYLEYLKRYHMDEMCLVLDADEFVEDFEIVKKYCDTVEHKDILISPKMRHFIGSFGVEDAQLPQGQSEHFVYNRLFRITEELYYPDGEHALLHTRAPADKTALFNFIGTTIWHLAYCSNMFNVRRKYETHIAKSEIHSRQFLDSWYKSHLFFTYPTKRINLQELPSLLLKEFGIDKDEIYFQNRGVEAKHFIDARHWKDYFGCQTIIEWGAGRGPRVFAMRVVGMDAMGIEISKWAIDNKLTPEITHGDITLVVSSLVEADLSVAYDVLEHIPYEHLNHAIDNLKNSTKSWILISVPVIGDPNLDLDKTHIIRETKAWWLEQFANKGLENVPTPDHFQYRNQVMIFRKK